MRSNITGITVSRPNANAASSSSSPARAARHVVARKCRTASGQPLAASASGKTLSAARAPTKRSTAAVLAPASAIEPT
jgi:hypothetical protein